MDFGDLQERLIGNLKHRVRSGETTERGLARFTGVSQPHLHNVLKGVRELTPATADRILSSLRISLLDLIGPAELGRYLQWRPAPDVPSREIPVLSDTVGGGGAWPLQESAFERFNLPIEHFAGLQQPIAARLAFDPAMTGIFSGGELIILETASAIENYPDPQSLYVVQLDAGVNVRWVRMGNRRFYVLNAVNAQNPMQWRSFDWNEISSEAIRAKVHFHSWTSPDHRRIIAPQRPPGTSPAPARRSAAN